MPLTSPHDQRNTTPTEEPSGVPLRALVTVVAVMAAAWIAAGSMGLLGHPLRHALTWLALGVAIVAGWPQRDQSLAGWIGLTAAVLTGVVMTTSALPAVSVLAVTVVAAGMVRSPFSVRGRAILIATLATAVLGIFRLAFDSIPTVWLAANGVGRALGWLAGSIAGRPLWVGASFGGVDFLVLMTALCAGWMICTTPPRLGRAIGTAAAILLGHLIYLLVLSFSSDLLAALPDVVLPEPSDISLVGVWAWGNSVRTLLPWSLPVLAAIIQLWIVVLMFRWATWLPVPEPVPENDSGEEIKGTELLLDALLRFGPALLAVAIPVLTVLGPSKSDLKGKTIVAYAKGHLDWLKPQHDVEEAGTYGMLPVFVESLGGRFVTSPNLSEHDLAEADVLLLLHPDRPWDKETLERVWQFVRRGGSLLLVAEPRIREGDSESSFNDVLGPTAMEVRYDTAIPETSHWEHSLETLAHPAADGIGDGRNRFGLTTGSSIRTRWPARPILAGRWGWSDPGSDAAATGEFRYDSGEKLGDLVLAAEHRLGQGTVVALGDASCLQNEINANCYVFTGRLLGYLAGKVRSPQAWWRQLLGLLAAAALIGLLAWQATAVRTAVAAVLLAASLAACTATNHWAARVLPDGRTHSLNNLACIDASHLEAYCTDVWDNFGLGGLSRTLMRSGYLPLLLPELTGERLERAGLLISIGPARPFSAAERKAVRDFVHAGGTFISMVGAERAAASRELLADFDFRVPPSPVSPGESAREPEPIGALYSRYLDMDDYETHMQFYAAWQIECTAPDAEVLKRGREDVPIIIRRPVGKGTVVVIGDTYLAVNQNLESAQNVLAENVTFWRWFLPRVTNRKAWIPPDPNRQSALPDELPPEDPANLDPDQGDPEQGDPPGSEVAP